MAMDNRFAVLIDADNISDKYIRFILDEISNTGVITYKRIYGDWTKPALGAWKNVLLEYSITPMQQYGYTIGKNATDAAMIIDAMDILYAGNIEGFCLVSSDSDFTRLASRLREAGKYVVGMGEKKTPGAFKSACNEFKYLDVIAKEHELECADVKPDEKMTTPESVKNAISVMVEELSDDEGWANLSDIGNILIKRQPDFDVRNFGFKKLTLFVKSLNSFEIKSVAGKSGNNSLIYIKKKV